ncbi:putative nuclease HARBI1 [Sitophilus oryzae]|uniref:Nuclease HARBI1 n=1 Tax=Sitophilus oryzae TaxID=7048 RepID=A0A6J2XDB9_SITOR|nr:putative nuclease HARBI1 [Sitophilus oryzae]
MNLMDTDTSSSSSSSEEELVFVRRRKIYRDRQNYYELYDDLDFFCRFRLTKPTVMQNFRGGCVPPLLQLLLTLRFFATGCMQITAADFIGVSRATACRVISRVTTALAALRPRYVKMYSDNAEMQRASEDFYGLASFPRAIGAIDCTLIKIDSPGGEDAEIFRCRKGFFALNVQTISDAKLKIRNIVARWPGSVHDQTIFNNSQVKREFETGRYGRYILVGDSGYALKKYLMTKLLETNTDAENLYNESIIRTRNVVERQYGVWKRRFPILKNGMRVKLETAMDIIVATAVLHNIALDMSEDIPGEWLEDAEEGENAEEGDGILELPNENINFGRQFRQVLINQHFAGLL